MVDPGLLNETTRGWALSTMTIMGFHRHRGMYSQDRISIVFSKQNMGISSLPSNIPRASELTIVPEDQGYPATFSQGGRAPCANHILLQRSERP